MSHLARKAARAVGEDDLGLAVAPRIEEEVADRRMRGVILEAGAELPVPERHPHAFAATADVDQALPVGQELQERCDPLRCVGMGRATNCKLEAVMRSLGMARRPGMGRARASADQRDLSGNRVGRPQCRNFPVPGRPVNDVPSHTTSPRHSVRPGQAPRFMPS